MVIEGAHQHYLTTPGHISITGHVLSYETDRTNYWITWFCITSWVVKMPHFECVGCRIEGSLVRDIHVQQRLRWNALVGVLVVFEEGLAFAVAEFPSRTLQVPAWARAGMADGTDHEM